MSTDHLTHQALLVALQAMLRNLQDTIADLLRLRLAQPEGPLRAELLDRVSCLDSIADTLRITAQSGQHFAD